MEQTIQLTQQEVLTLPDKQKKEITRKNLQRVLEELPKLSEQIPEIRRDFDMGICGVYEYLKKENLSQCSTYGCLLGNAARIFEKEFTEDLFGEFNGFYYTLFGRKFFPYLYDKYEEPKIGWYYLFSTLWIFNYFNDLDSAIDRIKNLLDNDLECNKYDYSTNKIIK